jgi:RHH-type rel operon transcriptional repressor/antitoxin RelB
MKRFKSRTATEAVRSYIELDAWQITEIEAALKEADAGDFATDQEVEAVLRKLRSPIVSQT